MSSAAPIPAPPGLLPPAHHAWVPDPVTGHMPEPARLMHWRRAAHQDQRMRAMRPIDRLAVLVAIERFRPDELGWFSAPLDVWAGAVPCSRQMLVAATGRLRAAALLERQDVEARGVRVSTRWRLTFVPWAVELARTRGQLAQLGADSLEELLAELG